MFSFSTHIFFELIVYAECICRTEIKQQTIFPKAEKIWRHGGTEKQMEEKE